MSMEMRNFKRYKEEILGMEKKEVRETLSAKLMKKRQKML